MATTPTFPTKTALALATCIAALTIYRHFDHAKGLSPAIFAESAHLNLIRQNPALTPKKTPTTPEKPQPKPASKPDSPCPEISPADHPRPQISPNLIDDCGDLDPFFAAINRLELPPTPGAPEIVTVLHYGDSPTTADLITGDVRSLLQQQFGDAGLGFLLTAKPWAWYQHRGVEVTDSGWKISTAVGKGREDTYGIGGASFEGDSDASSHISLKSSPQSTMDLSYLARPDAGTLAVSANDAALPSIPTADDTTHPAWHTVTLPPGTKTIDLTPESGSVRLFGESFRTGRRGILYDSLGLNGASTTVLSNGFSPSAWTAALQHEHPKLVIINYGTNESGFDGFVDKQYEPVLRATITRIRTALPGVPILVMSPMDRGRRTGVDQIETYDTIPKIVAIQKKVAAEQKCAFFDTFDAMGGDGTMSRWYTGNPRLVAGDLIHPTPQGASIVAQLFVKDLLLGYDRYLGHSAVPRQPVKSSLTPSNTLSPTPTHPKTKSSATGHPVALPAKPEPKPPQPGADSQ